MQYESPDIRVRQKTLLGRSYPLSIYGQLIGNGRKTDAKHKQKDKGISISSRDNSLGGISYCDLSNKDTAEGVLDVLTVGTLGLGNKKNFFLGSDVGTRAKLETMAPYGKKTRAL